MASRIELIKKARKLKALSDGGYRGEQSNASTMLKDFLAKHDLTLDDITEKQEYNFRTPTNAEASILSYCLLSIAPDRKLNNYTVYVLIKLDEEDYFEITTKLNCFHSQYLLEEQKVLKDYGVKEKEDILKFKALVLSAFITKHDAHWKPDWYAIDKCKDDNRIDGIDEYNKVVNNSAPSPDQDEPIKRLSDEEKKAIQKQLDEFDAPPAIDFNDKGTLYLLNKILNGMKTLHYKRARFTLPEIGKETKKTKTIKSAQ